jgi:hypothetical protein
MGTEICMSTHEHEHEHHHAHEQAHGHADIQDHNLKAAYLHVIADALTSVLALVALATGMLYGWAFMDPLMGIVGAILIGRWSWGLARQSAQVLVDAEDHGAIEREIRDLIEGDADNQVADLHVWRIAPSGRACILSLVTHQPRQVEHSGALQGRRDIPAEIAQGRAHGRDQCTLVLRLGQWAAVVGLLHAQDLIRLVIEHDPARPQYGVAVGGPFEREHVGRDPEVQGIADLGGKTKTLVVPSKDDMFSIQTRKNRPGWSRPSDGTRRWPADYPHHA